MIDLLKRSKAAILRVLLNENQLELLKYADWGYLHEVGWVRSFQDSESIDNLGNPIPWCTYPFISFIMERLNKSMELFEYGSGNSTLFYSQYVKHVISLEQ